MDKSIIKFKYSEVKEKSPGNDLVVGKVIRVPMESVTNQGESEKTDNLLPVLSKLIPKQLFDFKYKRGTNLRYFGWQI